ncbi:MAG: SpoIIIAH-like family protein [Lachnospiraceae bacterium]|nr:SpoIIIAH-like family protein [Lachnospiraceae bacterium]MCI9545170.1 SpoIIIAH-like family protein [Lachnospiraceae bacterium]
MKKVFKKNQVIITALAIMIAVAGYLSFSDVDFGMKEASTETADSNILEDDVLKDIESLDYDVSDETALLEENGLSATGQASPTESPQAEDGTGTEAGTEDTATPESGAEDGAQEDVSTDTPGEAVLTGSTGFAAQAKISREQVRSQNKENLMQIIDNPDVSEEQKQEAVASMVTLSETAERESAAEVLLESKGFADVVVNLTGNSADVVVPDNQLDDTSRAQIEDIVKRKTEIAPENIVITPLSQASD